MPAPDPHLVWQQIQAGPEWRQAACVSEDRDADGVMASRVVPARREWSAEFELRLSDRDYPGLPSLLGARVVGPWAIRFGDGSVTGERMALEFTREMGMGGPASFLDMIAPTHSPKRAITYHVRCRSVGPLRLTANDAARE